MDQRRLLRRSPSSISTTAAAPLKRLLSSVSRGQARPQQQQESSPGVCGEAGNSNSVQIINNISDLRAPQRRDVWAGSSHRFFGGGPDKGTVNVGWLVGTPQQQQQQHHIDIYEHSQG